METEPKIERTADAKRLQVKCWTCQECGSMHSRSQDAKRHWLDKHHRESDDRGPEDKREDKPKSGRLGKYLGR
jgi:ribosomal protein L37AE/L43A